MYKYWKSYFQQRIFIFFFCILFTALLLFRLSTSKAGAFLLINQFHTTQLDRFFSYYTYLGDGLFAILLIGGVFFINKKLSARLFVAYIISGIAAQVLKNLFPAPRPSVFFSKHLYNHFIEGVTLGGNASFPSGHTATAFAITAILAFQNNCRYRSAVLLLIAISIAFSRVYLAQHFLEDTLAGALVGLITAIVTENAMPVLKQKFNFAKKYFARFTRTGDAEMSNA